MDPTELMTFCTVARFRSFSKASNHLGIVQPTVTAQVKRLEARLGTPLFDRSKRPVELTPTGERLAELLTPLYEDLEGLLKRISGGEIENSVLVAATPIVINHLLPRPAGRFIAEHNGARLQLRAATTPEVIELVHAGDVDLGVVPFPPNDVRLDFKPLLKYSWVVVAPPEHQVGKLRRPRLEDLVAWPFVTTRKQGSHVRRVMDDAFIPAKLRYQTVLEVDTTYSVKRYVALGIGISVVPRYALDPGDRDKFTVVDVPHLFPPERAGVVATKNGRTPALVSRFMTTLRACLRELEAELDADR